MSSGSFAKVLKADLCIWLKRSLPEIGFLFQRAQLHEQAENVFEGKRKSRATSTFPRKDYKRCAGVYVIIENDIVVYVGKSDGHLWQRSYQHFWSHKPDPRGPHYYFEFSQTLDVHDYKMALIQIPGLNKNFEQIKDFKQITKEVLELENYLTYQFRATVLNKKIIEEKPVIQPIESDFGDLIPTPDEDIPFWFSFC